MMIFGIIDSMTGTMTVLSQTTDFNTVEPAAKPTRPEGKKCVTTLVILAPWRLIL